MNKRPLQGSNVSDKEVRNVRNAVNPSHSAVNWWGGAAAKGREEHWLYLGGL